MFGGTGMHLREIFYFITIVEEGSLSKAADKLYVTQPTLSHFLSKLEESLGVMLFTRKNNQLELTSAGKQYYETAKTIERSWKDLLLNLEKEKAAFRQEIRYGISMNGTDLVLNKLKYCLPQLRQQFPNLTFRTVRDQPHALEKMLLDGELDLVYAGYSTLNPHITYIEMTTCEVDLVVPKQDPLAAYSYQIPGNEAVRLPLSTCGDQPFALIAGGSILRGVEEAYFQSVKFHPFEMSTYSHPPAIKEYVCHHGLYALCPRPIHSQDVAYIALDPPMYYSYGIYYQKGVRQSPAVKALISFLKEYPEDYDI